MIWKRDCLYFILRKIRKLRQQDIATVLGMDRRAYGAYETGKRKLLFCHAIKLAQYYNVSLDYIAGLKCMTEDEKYRG